MNKPIIDTEKLLDKCMGNVNLVGKLSERFLSSLPDSITAIESAWNRGEMEVLRKAAHRLKGEAGTMCSEIIFTLAADLEQQVISKEHSAIELLIAELSSMIETIESFHTSLTDFTPRF